MKQSLQLRIGQSLTMTPQLQQAIRLLQLSAIELNAEVQQALESNMMLELDDDHEEFPRADLPPQSDNWKEDSLRSTESSSESENLETFQSISQEIPEELPVDSAWDDIYSGISSNYGGGSNGEDSDYEQQQRTTETLNDYLLWQTNLSIMSETDLLIAQTIIDALNEDGYLTISLEDVVQAVFQAHGTTVELDEVQAVTHLIQNFDPPGVAARDLGECLTIQLKQLPNTIPWLPEALQIIENHMDLLGARDYTLLSRRMKLTKEDLQKVMSLIQSLNPRPGAKFQQDHTEYVIPDVYVRKKKGAWQVELNADSIPQLRVNPYYAGLVRRANNTPDNVSLKSHLQEARWFIKSLQSRSETLLRVASVIVERQRAFLEYGEEHMKPLVLRDIAEVLGTHESTVSRVTTKKYMHTPRGIYELKYFFSSHLSTSVGEECSSTAIRAYIKKLIANENLQKPLSDSKIAAKLCEEQGINVARRTIAKYREAMNIPPSNERKRLV